MKMGASVDVRERRPFWDRCIGWSPAATGSWMALAFLIAAVTATIVLAIFGSGERGTAIALRITARWSFILFWFAYAGGAMSKLFGPRLAPMAWRGRDFGLAYASAQVVHVGLVLWLFYLAPGSNGGMVFFWVGIACTLLLALFSLPLVHEALGPRLWRTLRAVTMEYIALAFAVDFILPPVQSNGKQLLTYLPFALLLVGGAVMRLVVSVERLRT